MRIVVGTSTNKGIWLIILGVSIIFLFWIKSVSFDVSPFGFISLAVSVGLYLPLFTLLTKNGIRIQRRFGLGKRAWHAAIFYIILFSVIFSFLLTYKYSISFLPLPWIITFLFYLILHLIIPITILLGGFLLLGNRQHEFIDYRIALFVIFSLIMRESAESYVPFLLSQLNRYFLYKKTSLFGFYLNERSFTMNLMEIWPLLLMTLLVLVAGVPLDKIGLGRQWTRKATIGTLAVLMYVVLTGFFSIIFGTRHIYSCNLVSNLIGISYHCTIKWPLLEEIVFRGILQGFFLRFFRKIRYSNFFSILISSTLFSLYHYPFDYILFIKTFIYGILFGITYHLTGNLWVPLSGHVLNNVMVSGILE